MRLHFLAFLDHLRPSFALFCSKLRNFQTAYPPLSANVISETSLIEIHFLLGIDDVDMKLDAITKIVTEARITSGSQVRN